MVCPNAIAPPYRIEAIEIAIIMGAKYWLAAGVSGKQNRKNPYAPIFNRMDARNTLPAVGACTCAAGSQVCTGNIGTLMANAMAIAKNAQCWNLNENSFCINSGIEKVSPAIRNAMIATNRSVLPAKVNRKNLRDAYRRSGPPQTAMRRYIGMSIASQNTKNNTKSRATNTPMHAAVIKRRQK